MDIVISFTISFADIAVDEPVQESPVEDVGSAMNTVSQSSNSQTEILLPCQEIIDIEDDSLVSYHSDQLLIVKDATHNKGFTCIKETSAEVKKPEKGISFDILSEHFGKSLEDAANSFHGKFFQHFLVLPCLGLLH